MGCDPIQLGSASPKTASFYGVFERIDQQWELMSARYSTGERFRADRAMFNERAVAARRLDLLHSAWSGGVRAKEAKNGGATVDEGQDFTVLFRGRYRVFITPRDLDLVDAVVSNLDAGISRIESVFATKADIPFINFFLCPSRLVFDEFLRVITKIPTDATRIGTPQGHDMYILSPKTYRADAPHYGRQNPPYYDVVDFRRIVIHELVHLWEELSSPKGAMEAEEDWFSEGMAMYISEWYLDEKERRRLESDYSQGIIPKPEELSEERNYTWGCVLFEFLLKELGPAPLLEMIRETNHQNKMALLGLEESSYWQRYLGFVHARMSSGAQ